MEPDNFEPDIDPSLYDDYLEASNEEFEDITEADLDELIDGLSDEDLQA